MVVVEHRLGRSIYTAGAGPYTAGHRGAHSSWLALSEPRGPQRQDHAARNGHRLAFCHGPKCLGISAAAPLPAPRVP